MLFFGLIIVFVLEYTRPDQFLPFIASLKLYALVPITVFLASFAAESRNPNEVIFSSRIAQLLLSLLVLAAMSIVTALDKNRAWQFWQGMLGYVLMFVMIAKLCDSREKLKWLFRVIIAVHVWLVVLNPDLLTDPTQRSYIQNVTFLGDGNDFALSAIVALPMCFYLYLSSRSALARLIYVAAGAVVLGAILGTQSRGAALGMIAMALYFWMTSQKKGKATVLITIALVVVLAVASDAYLSRVQSITHYEEDGSAQGRLTAWRAGAGMALRRPLLGVGPGCFQIAFGDWGYSVPGVPPMNAHSMYFLALGELGGSGFVLVLGLLWVLFRGNQSIIKSISVEAVANHVDHRRLMVCTTASLVGFAVAGAFLSVLYYPHLYVVSGIIFVARRLSVVGNERDVASLVSPRHRRKTRREGRHLQQAMKPRAGRRQ